MSASYSRPKAGEKNRRLRSSIIFFFFTVGGPSVCIEPSCTSKGHPGNKKWAIPDIREKVMCGDDIVCLYLRPAYMTSINDSYYCGPDQSQGRICIKGQWD